MNESKPLFLPLIKKYYYLVKHGMQDCEIRPNNYRTSCGWWCCANVYPGRNILFSNGYGNSDKVLKEIKATMTTSCGLEQEKVPQWHIDAVGSIYGKCDSWLIAYI